MTTNKKVDPRVKKTKKAIHNAFIKLLSEKDIHDISIKEIAEVAEINRKTFYNHYDGIYQLVDEIENELVDKYNAALSEINLQSNSIDPKDIYGKLAGIITKDIDLHAHLVKFGFKTSLMQKIVEALKKSLMIVFSQQLDIDEKTLALSIEYWAAGLIAVLDYWYRHGCRDDLGEINHTVNILLTAGMQGLIKEKSPMNALRNDDADDRNFVLKSRNKISYLPGSQPPPVEH